MERADGASSADDRSIELLADTAFATRSLDGLAADARVEDAARRRAQRRWMREAAAEGASLSGLLVDLAEARTEVRISTPAGEHRGRITEIGEDFCAVLSIGGTEIVMRLESVMTITVSAMADGSASGARDRTPSGDRDLVGTRRLPEVLADWLVDRPEIAVAVADRRLSGELRSVGADLLSLSILSGAQREISHIPLPAAFEFTRPARIGP